MFFLLFILLLIISSGFRRFVGGVFSFGLMCFGLLMLFAAMEGMI